tara:strand:- start:251 stop:502 length:252 start_codon:yes stop_codon:yes gene_type:complete
MKIISIALIVLLSACSSGWESAHKNGKAEYVWVGCHVVTETPVNGAYAIALFGSDLTVGDYFHFKQVGHDGKAGEVVTGEPCE